MALRARSTAFEKTVSWSCTTNRCALSPVMQVRNCCTVPSAVGCSLTFQCTKRRVPTSSTTNQSTEADHERQRHDALRQLGQRRRTVIAKLDRGYDDHVDRKI